MQGVSSLLFEKTFRMLRKKECGWAWLLVKNNNQKMMEVVKKKGFNKGSKFQFFWKYPI